MGREAKVIKDRRCKQCGTRLLATAQQLREHLTICRRAATLGLVLPGQQEFGAKRLVEIWEP